MFFYRYGPLRDLHVLTHSFPPRRSSDLPKAPAFAVAGWRQHEPLGQGMAAVFEPEGAQIGKRLDDGARAIDLVDVRRPAAGDVEHIEVCVIGDGFRPRSEEHTSELQSLMRISYAVF